MTIPLLSTAASASDLVSIGGGANADLAKPVRGLFVGTGGDVRVTTVRGTDIVIPDVVSGSILPIEVKRVWLTGTSAGGIIGLLD